MKVLPKNATSWKNHSVATIGISMGSPQHTGIIFESLLNWTAQNFKSCIVDLSDTLNRYNHISNGASEDEARKIAHAEGNFWLREHQHLLDKTAMSVRIIRWDHWLNHTNYESSLILFRRAFAQQPLFQNAVMEDVTAYFERKGTSIKQITQENIQNAVHYLLEEIAAHSILYGENASTTLYPGKQHKCYELVRNGKIKDVPTGLQGSSYTRMIVYNFDEASDRKAA